MKFPSKFDPLAFLSICIGSILVGMWLAGITSDYMEWVLSEDPPAFVTGFYRGYFWFVHPVIAFFKSGHELIPDVRTNSFMWGLVIGVIQSGYLLYWLVRLVFERRSKHE